MVGRDVAPMELHRNVCAVLMNFYLKLWYPVFAALLANPTLTDVAVQRLYKNQTISK